MTSVALVTQNLDHGGGIPTTVRWMAAELQAHGEFDVVVFDLATSSRDPHSRRILRPGTWARPTLGFHEGSAERWGANAVELEVMRYAPRRELTRRLRCFDVVHVIAGGPALGNVANGAGVPMILQIATLMRWERANATSRPRAPKELWRTVMTRAVQVLERRALHSADAVLVMNERLLEHVRPTVRGTLLKAAPGVDTERFFPPSQGWARDGHLLSVCRLNDSRKGLTRLIDAYGLALKSDPGLPDLVLAGRGVPPASLHAHIAWRELASRISVLPDVAAEDLPDLYRTASGFLQASHEEGLGISVLEAMASGLPVIATETDGTRETVEDGVTGWLVPQTPEASVPLRLAERIASCSLHGATMGPAARDRCVRHFSTSVMRERHFAVYESLIGANSG